MLRGLALRFVREKFDSYQLVWFHISTYAATQSLSQLRQNFRRQNMHAWAFLLSLRITSIRSDVCLSPIFSLLSKCSLSLTLGDQQPSCIWIDDIFFFRWITRHSEETKKSRLEQESNLADVLISMYRSQTEEAISDSKHFSDPKIKEKDKFSA